VVRGQWSAHMSTQGGPLSQLALARTNLKSPDGLRSLIDTAWYGLAQTPSVSMQTVFDKVKFACGHALDYEMGFAHVSRWVKDTATAQAASGMNVIDNPTWCAAELVVPKQDVIASRVREYVTDALCPRTNDGAVYNCPTQDNLARCQSLMSHFNEQDRCSNLSAELDARCPRDNKGRWMCTTTENYAYCQENLPHLGQPGQCHFGPKVTLAEHCPADSAQWLVCESRAYYDYCKQHIVEVNEFNQHNDTCGWARPVATGEARIIVDYFTSHGSQYPCTVTDAPQNHKPSELSCGRPVQRARCGERGGVFVNCTGTNEPAYGALAAHVASEVARINAQRQDVPMTSSVNQQSSQKPKQKPAEQMLQVGSPDLLEVSVMSPGYCVTLSHDTTIPSPLFAVKPEGASGGPRFEFDCSPDVGDQGPPAPGASVDGYTTPRILIPYAFDEDKVKGEVKKAIEAANIRAVGQKKVGPGPVEELVQARDRVRDGDFTRVDVQRTDIQQDAQQRVGAVTIDAAQKAKVAGTLTAAQAAVGQVRPGQTGIERPDEEVRLAGKLASGQTATGKLSPGQTALNAARPEEEEQGRRDLVTGAALAGTGAAAPVAHMAPVMGNAPAGAAAAGAPPPVSAAPSAPAVKPDITAASQVTIANRPADWNAPLMLDARDALRAANGVCLFTLRYTARNIGVAPAGAFSSTLASSAVPGPSERLWPGIEPASASTQSDVVSLKPGLNTLTLWLDQRNEVQELNEGNNQSRLQVNLTGACDATARTVRPGTTVAAGAVHVNPVTGLPAIRPPTGFPTPTLPSGAQVGRPGASPKVPTTVTSSSGVVVSKPGPAPTPAAGTVIVSPGTLAPMQGGVDLVPVGSLTIAGRKADWSGAVSLEAKDAQRAEGGVCTFSIEYAVRNGGNAASGTFGSTLSISTGGASVEASWPGLAAGAQSGRTDSLDLKPGLNLLTLVVDRSGQVKESNEANNQVGLSVSVSGTCAVPAPPSVPGSGVKPPTVGATPTPAAPTVPLGPKALATPVPAKK
jgi:hypothetical protein